MLLKTSSLNNQENIIDQRIKWVFCQTLFKALQGVENLLWEFDPECKNDKQKKLSQALDEFYNYIRNNRGSVINYGERYRHKERIVTAFVESTVNEVISKRMVKKQQMRWTKKGAHLLLQVRIQVLNETLKKRFCKWYPNMEQDDKPLPLAA